MGMGGGDKGSSTETKEVKLPPWVDAAAQANYARAQAVADRPYAAYGGPTVAGLDPQVGIAKGLLGTLDDYMGNYKDASSILKTAGNYNPSAIRASSVTADMLPSMNRDAYMNPWINDVERRAVQAETQAGKEAMTGIASDAAKKGAFGGSRQAIQAAVQGAQTNRNIGDLSAKLRSEGFNTATQAMQADAERKLKAQTQTGEWAQSAQTEYEKNKIAAQQGKIAAAAGLTSTADAGQKARMNEIAERLGIGNIYQQQQQREYDDLKGKWESKRNYPLEQLNIVMAALGMTPYGHTETSTKTSEQQAGGQGAGMIGGLMQMLPGLMSLSDRDTKTDIEKLGEDHETGLPLYAYRYKGDPKSYPKAVGPMAQDVEKKYPKLVRKVAGKRVIDLSSLAA
jgi:Chaperone of endosialidase